MLQTRYFFTCVGLRYPWTRHGRSNAGTSSHPIPALCGISAISEAFSVNSGSRRTLESEIRPVEFCQSPIIPGTDTMNLESHLKIIQFVNHVSVAQQVAAVLMANVSAQINKLFTIYTVSKICILNKIYKI